MNILAPRLQPRFAAQKPDAKESVQPQDTPAILEAQAKQIDAFLQSKGFGYSHSGGLLTTVGIGNNELFVYLKNQQAVKKAFEALKDPNLGPDQQLYFNNIKVQLKVMGSPRIGTDN